MDSAQGFMSSTMPVHVRYKSLYNSLPSSVQHQREKIKFCGLCRTPTKAANFLAFWVGIERWRYIFCLSKLGDQ